MTRSGARTMGRLAALGTTVLAVLTLGVGLAKADVYNYNDIGYYQGEVGQGHTEITCYPDRHQAYFSLRLQGSFGISVPQTVAAKIDSYRWNGQKWACYSTTGWMTNTTNELDYHQLGGVASGYWVHYVTYRWVEPNNTVTQGGEWISSYTQLVPRSGGGYSSYTAQYCTT